MEPRTRDLEDQKQRIIQLIKIKGPSLPVHVSNYLKVDTLLAGAFLSELVSDKQIKMSRMRVGNSPIYFLPGQEEKLQQFSSYLVAKEREAFELLKSKKILRDTIQEPAIRVALRSLKDFAIPLNVRGEIFWRYFLVSSERAFEDATSYKLEIQPKIQKEPEKKLVIEKKPAILEVKNIPSDSSVSLKSDFPEVKKIKKSKDKPRSDFIAKVEDFLRENNIKVYNEISVKKKEYKSIVKIDGKFDYLCIAREKKAINDKDLMSHLELGRKQKLPVLFLSNGEASKKAVDWLDYLGNLIIFKKFE